MESKQQTLRVTGLPLATQIDDVKQFFGDRIKSEGRQIVGSVGPFTQDAIAPHKQTTVSFSSHDAAMQALGLEYGKRRFAARGGGEEHISLDHTFEGLTTLYSCANPETGHPDIDIVALHGLNGHAWNTFTTSETIDTTTHRIREFNWLRDRLPMLLEYQKIYPRVMSFGYDADVWMTKSVADISVPVKSILDCLDVERKQNPHRPLFFIGHSLGGIVIKEAIVALANDEAMKEIINQGRYLFPVKGCLFFGVPHTGAEFADKAFAFLNVLSFVFDVKKSNIKDLKSKSQRFANISAEFRAVQTEQEFPVISFFETVKYKHHGVIVGEESATYDYPGCPEPFGVNRNHKDMVSYSTGDDHVLKPAVTFLTDCFKGQL